MSFTSTSNSLTIHLSAESPTTFSTQTDSAANDFASSLQALNLSKSDEVNATIQNLAESLQETAQTTKASEPVKNTHEMKRSEDEEEVANKGGKYTVKIIDATEYPDQAKAIEGVRRVLKETGLIGGDDYLSEQYKGNAKYHTLLAVKDGIIVGAALGKIEEDHFEVYRLGVGDAFRSDATHRSKEKVGTRLMLKAMEKTQQLGKSILSLDYDPGCSYDKYYKGEYKKDCERRSAFYNRFDKFGVSSTHSDSSYHEMDGGVEITRTQRYNLSRFIYKRALEILG